MRDPLNIGLNDEPSLLGLIGSLRRQYRRIATRVGRLTPCPGGIMIALYYCIIPNSSVLQLYYCIIPNNSCSSSFSQLDLEMSYSLLPEVKLPLHSISEHFHVLLTASIGCLTSLSSPVRVVYVNNPISASSKLAIILTKVAS